MAEWESKRQGLNPDPGTHRLPLILNCQKQQIFPVSICAFNEGMSEVHTLKDKKYQTYNNRQLILKYVDPEFRFKSTNFSKYILNLEKDTETFISRSIIPLKRN